MVSFKKGLTVILDLVVYTPRGIRKQARMSQYNTFRKKTTVVVLLATLLIAGGAFAVLGNERQSDIQTVNSSNEQEVTAHYTLNSDRLNTRTIETTGTLEAKQSVQVSSEVSGRVEDAPYNVGSPVAAGSQIVILEDTNLQAQLDQHQAQLSAAQKRRDSADVAQKNGRKALVDVAEQSRTTLLNIRQSAVEPLFSDANDLGDFGVTISSGQTRYVISEGSIKDGGSIRSLVDAFQADYQQFESAPKRSAIVKANRAEDALISMRLLLNKLAQVISSDSLDDAQERDVRTSFLEPVLAGRSQISQVLSDLRRARQSLDQAKTNAAAAEVKSAKAAVARTKARLSDKIVEAPFDSVVADKHVEEGQFVQPGTLLYELVDTTSWEVYAELSDTYNQSLNIGQEVLVDIDGLPGKYTGKIGSVSPEVNQDNKRVAFKILLPSLPASARSGLFARVSIPVTAAQTAYKIPKKFLSFGFDGPRLQTKSGQKLPVNILYENEDGIFVEGDSLEDGLVIKAP